MTTHLILGWLSLCALANAQCNPLTAACPPINGLAASTYEIDFTKQTSTPANWTLADQAIVNYSANGAEFTFAKRYDAPYLWTSFYMLFGRIEVTLQAATGQGIVTGAVMMSDDLDEIDWEWSGSNFNSTQGKVQTNYFGKGQTGNYDRGTQPAVDSPTTKFHTYVLDWTKDSLTWSIDGSVVRSMSNNGATSGSNQYPQTPSRLHIGLWNGGDQSSDWGIVGWVGGYTDLTKAPYTAYVKSVKITNYNPCSSWEYPAGFSGKWQDVKCTNQTIATPSAPPAALKPTPANLPCNYTVAAGDYGSKIADKLGVSFSDLNSTNQPINWDKLLLGQILKVPGGMCSNGTTTSFNNITMTSTSSSSLTSSSSITSSYTTSSASSAMTSTPSTSTTAGATPTYTVASGDSGYRIAQKLGCSFDDMKKANPSCNWDKLLIGQKLTACSNSNLTSSTTSSPSSSSLSTSSACASSSSSSGSSTSSTSITSGSSQASSSPSTPSSNTALASPAPTSCNLTYIVAAGDFGNKIAAGFGIYFNDLSKLNPGVDWDKLQVGQIINVPSKPPTKPLTGVSSACNATATGNSTGGCLTYQVQKGDYGNSIAALFGIFFNDLSKANSGLDWDKLQVGQVLQVPGKPARTPSVGMGSTACSASATTTTSTVASTTSSSSTTSSTSSSSSSTSSTQASSTTSTQPPASSSSPSQSATSMTPTYANPQSTISSSTTPMASSSASAPPLQDALGRACGYTVSAGDYGYKIADKLQCSFDQLNATNPGVDWSKLLIGVILKVPGSACTGVSPGSSSSSIISQSTSSTSFSTSPLSTAQSAMPTSTTTASPSSSSSPLMPSSTSSSSSTPSSSSTQSPMPSSTGSSTSTSSFSSQSQSSSISSSVTSPSMSSSISSSVTSSSMSSPSSLSSSLSTTTMMCNRDNCLNNFMDTRYISSAYSFCTTYLSGSRASTTSSSFTPSSSSSMTSSASSSSSSGVVALPPWLGNCKNDSSRVSSACRCLCTASAMFTTIGSNTMLAFNLVGNKVVNMTPTSMSTPSITSGSSTSSSSSSTVQNAWVSFASKYYSGGSAGLLSSSPMPSATMTGENRYYGSHGDNRGGWGHDQGQFGQGKQWKRGASHDHDMADGAANVIIDNQHREQGQPHPVITQAPSTNGASKGLGKGKPHKREAAPEPDVTIPGGEQAWANAAAQMSLDAASMQSQYQPQVTQGSRGQGHNYGHGIGPKKREAEPEPQPEPQPEPEPEECDLFKTCTGSIPLESMIPAGGYTTVNGVLKGVGEVEGWASATTVPGGWAPMYTGTAPAQTRNLVPHHGHAVNLGKREAGEGEAHKNPKPGQGLREHKHEHERMKPHSQAPAQRKREAEAEMEGGSGSEEHLGNGERPPWWKW